MLELVVCRAIFLHMQAAGCLLDWSGMFGWSLHVIAGHLRPRGSGTSVGTVGSAGSVGQIVEECWKQQRDAKGPLPLHQLHQLHQGKVRLLVGSCWIMLDLGIAVCIVKVTLHRVIESGHRVSSGGSTHFPQRVHSSTYTDDHRRFLRHRQAFDRPTEQSARFRK